MTQVRLNIAVFIDFDNIEIGVKSTLGERFDVGAVLEAIKERGEVVTKVAYGDWARASDYSRSLTQHAVRMVQRNLTPGGDKNGADINLALDALEMAFTHHHINAFVIVGGDSDFITLVEKLKQYDRKVFVVGGRAFTSMVLQKNCHEFIAYENILGSQAQSRRPVERVRPVSDATLAQTFPLIRRALKVLADREVSAQLGLLKSTLLQLDSAFSERDYGASTFRDFVQKLANTGFVQLKGTDRSLIVELRETDGHGPAAAPRPVEAPAPAVEPPAAGPTGPEPVADPAQWAEGVRAMREIFARATSEPRWPMYLRNLRQFLRTVDETFDERRYGFRGVMDAIRMGQREGLFRVERDRRGIVRVFPGPGMPRAADSAVPTDATMPPMDPVAPGDGELLADEAMMPEAVAAPMEAVLPTSPAGDLVELGQGVGGESAEPYMGTEEAEPPEAGAALEAAPAKPARRRPARRPAAPRKPRRPRVAATKA